MPPDEGQRPEMPVDIACVGFGPAMGGFLTTLTRHLEEGGEDPGLGSRVMPGAPLQVVCYERADDLAFGVSGVATRARAIRQSLPDLEPSQIPMAQPILRERLVYLRDPGGASRRSLPLRLADRLLGALERARPARDFASELPFVPGFLRKEGGLVLSIGQFNQWVAARLMASGRVQLWPASPVSGARFEHGAVVGVRLVDQGTGADGAPRDGFVPGMDVRAALTVIGDGAVGAVGLRLDEAVGLPEGHERADWAVGMKLVVDLAEGSPLAPGTVLHTFGYPEPEIFGFLYVHAERLASLGIFVPSWLDSPVRTSYRYLQHWMTHPYLWPLLRGGVLRSWGAKTLQESGRRGEPRLVGDGYARIGEGSGSTNILTGSGVDEAWATGAMLADGVAELLRDGEPFTGENLDRVYVGRRRASWVEREGRAAQRARDGFRRGFIVGLAGMGLAGITGGRLAMPGGRRRAVPSLEEHYRARIPAAEIASIRSACAARGVALHDALMERAGWPPIPYDGALLLSHQDALLRGGKVQAPPGYADHVVFLDRERCARCDTRLCIEICSGQAIAPGGDDGLPRFDRDKCVHCGACLWSCAQPVPGRAGLGNIELRAGAGGLHSAEN